jgi:predicted phage terminase large subunit-like protein
MSILQKTVRLHQAQQAFRRSDALYRGFVGGIGSGKSWAGAYDLLRRAKPGRLYLCSAPTYPMLKDASLRTFLSLAREFNFLADTNRSEMIVTLGNRAEVLFRSADDPERLRGPNLSGMWLDEASLIVREGFDIAIGRLREQGEQGWLSATFTPKGRSHWTYEVFGRRAPDTELFHARTRDNPFLPPRFEQTLRQQYTGLLADQELEGLFVEIAGAEWPAAYFPDSIWFEDWPVLASRVIALDPSKGRDARYGDYSAYVLLGRDPAGGLWCEADLARRPTSRIVADGLELARWFVPDAFVVETNQFQELLADDIADQSAAAGVMLPVVPVDNRVNKQVRIRRLGPYLARGNIRFRRTPGTELLVQQLREFPEAEHNDGPDSLEMAIRVMGDLYRDEGAEDLTVLRP